MNIPLPLKPKVIFEEGNRAVFEIGGLYPGYGQTIGNSLRRVLLSSLKGSAITSFKIEGVSHEFSTIEGVMEDVVDLMLNLKRLRFKLHEEGPFTIFLALKGPKEVSGKDFETPSQVEVMNGEERVVTLTKKIDFRLEAKVESGLGYVPVEAKSGEKMEVGVMGLDAAFSPVRHVNCEVENMRVGDRTDYNLIRMHIETDGSISPRDAFQQATKILVDQLTAIGEGFLEISSVSSPAGPQKQPEGEEEDKKEEDVLRIKLDDLKLSSRTLNVLREAGIKTVGGASKKKEETLREIKGMGDKGIQEVKKALGNLGLTLKQ